MKKAKTGIFIIFVILLSMAGCGKELQINSSDKQPGGDETIQWNASHSSMPERYEMATIDDDRIYACRYGEEGLIISIFETDSVELTESYIIPNVTELKSLSINSSKQICLYCSTESGDVFWTISQNGDISSIEDIHVEDLGELPVLKKYMQIVMACIIYGMKCQCLVLKYTKMEKKIFIQDLTEYM